MKIDNAVKLMDDWANWWLRSLEFEQEGNSVRIICPMLNRNNDHMSIFLADDPETHGYILTDIGETISDLSASGCDVLGSESRRKKLEQTIQGFGVQLSNNELFVKTGHDSFPQKFNMLMQSMASVDDLFFTAKTSVRSFFLDDVANWLDANSIRYMPDIKISGKSGFEAKFDFAIPKNGNIAPERLIKVVSNPAEASVKNALFGWNDIEESRKGSKSFLFLDATSKRNGVIDASLIQACRSYHVEPVAWNGDVDSAIKRELAA